MFKRILVPVDGSELAEKAIGKALDLAVHFQAELFFLRVYTREQMLADPVSPFDTYHLVVTAEDAKKRANDYLEALQTKFAALDITVQAHAIESTEKAGRAIVVYADENDVDLIVMTTHGYTGFRRLVMGSVTTEVLHHALSPVLVVPSIAE